MTRKPEAANWVGRMASRLRQTNVLPCARSWPPGPAVVVEGEYVEPVQLQVICSDIWESAAGSRKSHFAAKSAEGLERQRWARPVLRSSDRICLPASRRADLSIVLPRVAPGLLCRVEVLLADPVAKVGLKVANNCDGDPRSGPRA